jgi:hypothetical protein
LKIINPEKAFATEPQRHGDKHLRGLDNIPVSFLFTIPDLRIFDKSL